MEPITLERITIENPVLDSKGEGVRFVRFNDSFIVGDLNIQKMGNELFSCFESSLYPDYKQNTRICIDMGNINFISASVLGEMIKADKKQKTKEKKPLGLVEIRPEIYEFFAMTRIDRLFEIKDTREDYLRR